MSKNNYTTQAVKINAFGPSSGLVVESIQINPPADEEILIDVHAAGVNRPDVFQRLGLYPPPAGASEIPGLEVSGVISEIGRNVSRFKVGDEVIALLTGGGYAAQAIAHQDTVMKKPKNLSFEEAAGIPETFFTVWSNVFMRGQLKAGEKLLVHGGTSGIGTTAIMIAKALNIPVLATAGSDEKCAFCREIGAIEAINYKTKDFEKIVTEEFGGVDVILDMVAGDYTQKNLNCLNPEGRLFIIAFLKGSQAHVDLRPLMMKRLTISGSTLRARSHTFKRTIAEQLETIIFPLIEAGTIKPVIHKIFSMGEASAAHDLMESSQHMGKIIIKTKD